MKNMKWLLPVFVVVALVQLAVPAGMIVRREITLKEGKAYKFHTAPVDPYDAFRGRYVALSLEPNSVAVPANSNFEYRSKVYVTLEEGPDGFARFTGATIEPPVGRDYIKADSWGSYPAGKLTLRLPFDRFYMEESAAPKAEKAYREHSRRGQQDAYVTIRVRNGFAVLENLYVAGKPITEFVREQK